MEHTNVFYNCYDTYKMPAFDSRYITPDHLPPYFKAIAALGGTTEIIGKSVNEESIVLNTLGRGPLRILMWSQMHGNESTTTRALADLISFLQQYEEARDSILERTTLYIIPILNPDGARAYTRVNATETDLNRDAQERTQPESRALRAVFDRTDPHFCLNLHDQRTIFSVGDSALPATVSFLSPAYNASRDINTPRETGMKLIAGMNQVLQEIIPGQVGRYDDGFNLNCVGDTFMAQGKPTILFESGHYQDDYRRDMTRKCIATALMACLEIIAHDNADNFNKADYMRIPENEKRFCDILVKDVVIREGGNEEKADLAFMFKETLENNAIAFVPVFDKKVAPGTLFGHRTLQPDAPLVYEALKDGELEDFAEELRKRLRLEL